MNFDKIVNRKNTNSIKWDTIQGDILPFGIADMDFELPKEVKEAIKKRIEEPYLGYTFADTKVIDAIIRRFKRAYHVDVKKEWIVLLSGIVPAFKAIGSMSKQTLLNVPNYNMLISHLQQSTELLESTLVFDGNKFQMNFDEMENLVTEDTKTLFLVNPNNPVGKVYSKQELIEVSQFASSHDMIVACDEAHCDIVFEGYHYPFWSVDEYAKEHSITLYSTGKTYNMAGLPFAFAIIPNEELRSRFNGLRLSQPNQLFCAAATAAYDKCDYWIDECMNYLSDNKDFMVESISKYFPEATIAPLEGTYLMWVDFTPYFTDPYAEILEQAHVKFNDGRSYHGGKWVRINIATQRANLIEAMDRLKKMVKITKDL